jgi:hypothetical protein
MNRYKILLAIALTFTGLVWAYGGGNPPCRHRPADRPEIQHRRHTDPEQQIDRIDALNAAEDALLAEYDTYPYYEEDHLPATFAPDTFASYKCGVWFPLAIAQGWPDNPAVLKTLDRAMWRESRCQADACSQSDSGLKCRDAGLLQVNQLHTSYLNDLGWSFPDDMLNPANNLRFAWLLYSGREANGQCGWQPWSIKC